MITVPFSDEEFTCKCGCGQNQVSNNLLTRLTATRLIAGIPFVITSGYRCPKHEWEVSGRSFGPHVDGLAADIAYTDSRALFVILDSALCAGFIRIGIGPHHVHLDISSSRDNWVMWLEGVSTAAPEKHQGVYEN